MKVTEEAALKLRQITEGEVNMAQDCARYIQNAQPVLSGVLASLAREIISDGQQAWSVGSIVATTAYVVLRLFELQGALDNPPHLKAPDVPFEEN